ncbi:MAG: hypothetical protein MEQ74_08840 [Paracoccus sp.]|nr:hypothetical protein [Paracoccus sp. (in: a-proteobacteria)]
MSILNYNPDRLSHEKSAVIRRHFAPVRHLRIVVVLDDLDVEAYCVEMAKDPCFAMF